MLDSLPVSIIMRCKTVDLRWGKEQVWSTVSVIPAGGQLPTHLLQSRPDQTHVLVPGLQLELHRDENAGYFENWIAPAPKVFVMWRLEQEQALPIWASVSYDEGARMLDSGESADGVPMAPEIYAWLANYLEQHYQVPEKPMRESRDDREQRKKRQSTSRFS